MKYSETYRKLKPVYDSYRQSKDKEKFLRGHESKIILFEAAARELKKMNALPIPTTENIKAEMITLAAKKEVLLSEYKQLKKETKEFEVIKTNVDVILDEPTQQVCRNEIEIIS